MPSQKIAGVTQDVSDVLNAAYPPPMELGRAERKELKSLQILGVAPEDGRIPPPLQLAIGRLADECDRLAAYARGVPGAILGGDPVDQVLWGLSKRADVARALLTALCLQAAKARTEVRPARRAQPPTSRI